MVLKRLFSRSKRSSTPHSLPDGQRVYAVGDIHGRLDLLDRIIESIREDDERRGRANTRLIFLGDLVDRGPDSKGVIDRLIQLRNSGVVATFLLGNHDEIFLKALAGDIKAARMLTRIGGRETILSYGMSLEEYQAYDFHELVRVLGRLVPSGHVEFLSTFEDYAEVGDFLFVHAGVRPGIPIDEQVPTDLRWIRREFLNSRLAHDRMVVHGHSISDEIDVRSNRIGIDTGAFASGRLTALGLEGQDIWFLTATGAVDPKWEGITD
ncbi:MAG: serine/threonine protein phosphatase [Sphingosinicella sp.]|nr:serine/threonine protein phosphatase [Sphingosinicella sp.]